MSLTVLYWLLLALMLVGVIGAVVPGIPGSSLIVVAILVWGVASGFGGLSWAIAVACLVLLLSVAIDFLATYWGAKGVGASKWGQIGAIIGLILGFFGLLPAWLIGGPLLGILVGPLLGAFIGEFLYRRELELEPRIRLASKASLGIVVGSVIGNLIEGMLAFAAVVVFVFTTWPPGTGI
ncbi:DUF456 family protein [Lyngbya aestuarii]|uniref:DUF456 family protein n=1 Tax=Lyngbya aestuarii TaxID=118322 RepID=UPI00403E1E3E